MGRHGLGLALALAACGCGSTKRDDGAASGAATTAGAPAVPSTDAAPAPPAPPAVTLVRCAPAPALPYDDILDPRSHAILGRAALDQGGAFASLTGTGDVTSGLDDSIYGGLLGSDGGADALGSGRGGTGARTRAQVQLGQPSVTGAFDKAIVRRYLERNFNKLQYCYEKGGLASPGLAGAGQVSFTIDLNGVVQSVSASGGAPSVMSCIADVIHGIEFPKPKDGEAQVRVPFTLAPDRAPNGGSAPAGSGSGSGSSSMREVDAPELVRVSAGAPAAPAPATAGAWTPYALVGAPDDASAGPVSDAVRDGVASRLTAVDACFGATASGSLRAMLSVTADGRVDGVRAGGLGVPVVERCVAQALASFRVSTVAHPPMEIACDLARGPEQAWRVSPDDFAVVEVAHGARPPALPIDRDVLVVAAPDATGAELNAVVGDPDPTNAHWTLLAVRDDGGAAPRYLAAIAVGPGPKRLPARPPLKLAFHTGRIGVCIPGAKKPMTVAADRPLDVAFTAVAAGCRAAPCSDAVVFYDEEGADTATVAAALARARALGFTRALYGGPHEPGCQP